MFQNVLLVSGFRPHVFRRWAKILRLHPRRSGSTIQSAKVRSRIFIGVVGPRSYCKATDFKPLKKVDVNPMVILLVEDDLHVQYFIWKLLKAAGFTVLTAANAEFELE